MIGQNPPPGTTIATRRSTLPAFVLWFFFGTVGIHRFYLQRRHALTMLLVGLFGWLTVPLGVGLFILLGVGAWWLFDLFAVARWVREHNDWLGLG